MSDDQIIAVVQARKEGKEIQCRFKNKESYWAAESPGISWDFDTFDYRVKPEPKQPRELWLYPVCDGERFGFKLSAAEAQNFHGVIHVREVLP